MSFLKEQLTEYLQQLIVADRYSRKANHDTPPELNQTVLATINDAGTRQLGRVTEIHPENRYTITLYDETTITLPRSRIEIPLEDIERVMQRVARAIGTTDVERRGLEAFLLNGEFIPGGRIITMAGRTAESRETAYNCYVIPCPHDSRRGILASLADMADIMATGGGVGINLSSIRPNHSYVKGVNGRASGAVSWGALFSFTTGLIEQAGSRRGALMAMLAVWHPDIHEFINSKRKAGQITNANISVCITDAFMDAVQNDSDWELIFPVTTHPQYNTEWDGDIQAWKAKGYPIVVHERLKARALWNEIIESAHASAEPGIWFQDRSNHYSNSYYYNQLVATNPCGEQPLPNWGVCNLGAINLSRFYDAVTDDVNWDALHKAVQLAVRFLNNVIDYTLYVNDEVKQNQLAERRVGLGSMGFAELLIKLKIRYGSPESIAFIDRLFSFIASTAYRTSATLASEKGAFERYSPVMLQSAYMQHLFQADPSLEEYINKCGGLHNVTLLTQAPTGTTGTMVNTSTGLEPFFAWTYTRKGRLGNHTADVPLVADYRANHPNAPLPDYFVTSMELTPREHVEVQAAFQRWIDSAVSKTCNVPNDYSVQQVAEIYEYMYELGCKGGTIYRDGSRSEQVLNLEPETPSEPLRLGNVCPQCNQDTLEPEGNCISCVNPDCDYSLCSL